MGSSFYMSKSHIENPKAREGVVEGRIYIFRMHAPAGRTCCAFLQSEQPLIEYLLSIGEPIKKAELCKELPEPRSELRLSIETLTFWPG